MPVQRYKLVVAYRGTRYHGWQQQEVAELFAVHPRTIRRWWQSALVRLQPILKDFKID